MNSAGLSSVGIIPYKVLMNSYLLNGIITEKKIIPFHLQICPTNKCNLNCNFCSCSDRDQSQEIPIANLKKIVNDFYKLGTRAVSIIGGGEPLCHPHINEFISYCHELGLKISLVTNGILLDNLDLDNIQKLTWCRISFGDDRSALHFNKIKAHMENIISRVKNVDFSFSYVVTTNGNSELQKEIAILGSQYDFHHIRFISDIYNRDTIDLDIVKNNVLDTNKVSNDKIFFEKKSGKRCSTQNCYLHLLKPVIGADGYVYPCCGIQYTGWNKDYNKTYRICKHTEYSEVTQKSQPINFDCNECFYDYYNSFFDTMLDEFTHVEWV